jgi:hypothetical protein
MHSPSASARPAGPHAMSHAVEAENVTDAEAESVAQAVDIYRATPTSPWYFHSVPIRDDSGRLCEVRFYLDDEMQHPLAVIRIADNGALAPIEDLR